jgi:hypothetical protein
MLEYLQPMTATLPLQEKFKRRKAEIIQDEDILSSNQINSV